jgi:simple sugar transport system permease protein
MDFEKINIVSLLLSSLRVATPLVFAALAGLISERAGIIQIALEGMMLIGALGAAVTAHYTGSAWIGLAGGATAGLLIAALKAFFVLKIRIDQIIAGTAINILAVGTAPFITKILFDSTGSSPALSLDARFSSAPLYMAALTTCLISYLYSKTRAGLYIQFAGEAPTSLEVSGTSVYLVRWCALLSCGALAGIGGTSISLFLASSYSPNMTAGRGFIALAALIFGRWKPLPTVAACLLFGFTDAVQIQMQGGGMRIPVQFIQIFPYIFTIVALAGFFGQSRAPKALGKD